MRSVRDHSSGLLRRNLGIMEGLGFRVFIPLKWRIKWKIEWKMRWKLGGYRHLRGLIQVTILGKPSKLLHILIMVTYFKFLTSNPL